MQFFTDERLDELEARIARGELYPFLSEEGWTPLTAEERLLFTTSRVCTLVDYAADELELSIVHAHAGGCLCITADTWRGSTWAPDGYVTLHAPNVHVWRDRLQRCLDPEGFEEGERLRRALEEHRRQRFDPGSSSSQG